MSIHIRKCWHNDMTKFDDLYEVAVDSYGLITSSEAKELGVKPVEMKRYAGTGRLERRGRGVYRLVRWVPTLYDGFAEAVALVGPDAYSHGDAVLALLELAMANPRTVAVASPRRVRRALSGWATLCQVSAHDRVGSCFGIPSQEVGMRSSRARARPCATSCSPLT